jgi:hypothetical protein
MSQWYLSYPESSEASAIAWSFGMGVLCLWSCRRSICLEDFGRFGIRICILVLVSRVVTADYFISRVINWTVKVESSRCMYIWQKYLPHWTIQSTTYTVVLARGKHRQLSYNTYSQPTQHLHHCISNSSFKYIYTFNSFHFFFSLLLCWVVYIVVFTQVLTMYQIYHTWIYLLYHSLLFPPPLIPGTVSTGIIFPFTYMCTHFLHCIHPPTLFLLHSPLLLIQDLFTPLFSGFVEEKRENKKNMTF